MILHLTDEEAHALTMHLRQALDNARYPFAPRLDPLKAILAKLDPPEPLPAAATGHGLDPWARGDGGRHISDPLTFIFVGSFGLTTI